MTIHRVGPNPDTEPHRQKLGRVLVTIDDLDALITLVTQHAASPGHVRVSFNGGHLTDAADIRHLTDDELRTLKIATDRVEINLDRESATAVGERSISQEINTAWARTRQTTVDFRAPRKIWLPLVSCLLGVAGFVMAVLDEKSRAVTIVMGVLVCILFVLAAYLIVTGWRRAKTGPGAIIKPMTMAEWRQLQVANQNPGRANVIASIAVIVAILAIASNFVTPVLFGR